MTPLLGRRFQAAAAASQHLTLRFADGGAVRIWAGPDALDDHFFGPENWDAWLNAPANPPPRFLLERLTLAFDTGVSVVVALKAACVLTLDPV
ncbi:MAG: hypothetical protein JWM80_439 [Cyanobacteria bacterium RYN_339]|nr:hypothetical protein [Cyanobacteria bacterium RYN_339]